MNKQYIQIIRIDSLLLVYTATLAGILLVKFWSSTCNK